MMSEKEIEERKPIWEQVSLFYLDTELDTTHYRDIANSIASSPFNITQVKEINRKEVFPVLFRNFTTIAGTWEGFDIDWLVKEIVAQSERTSLFSKSKFFVAYLIYKRRFTNNWVAVEKFSG